MVRNAWLPFLPALCALACAAAPAQAAPPMPPDTAHAGGVPDDRPTPRVPLEHLPALAGDYFRIDSAYTGRPHHVYVRLPEGYAADPDRRWPVVYLLDGDSLFPLLAPTHLFLHYDEQLPEAIVVGIAYGSFDPAINRRHVDFSAPGPDTPDGEGGAPAFLAFLERELLPMVEGRHRADPGRRVLVGQSRSGYFVLWSALRRPDLFLGRVASNPAFSRTRADLFAEAAAHTRDDLAVVVASGARDQAFRMDDARAWMDAWRAHGDRPWALHHEILADGTHAASIGEAYRRAMLVLFRDGITAAKAQTRAKDAASPAAPSRQAPVRPAP
ncbi:alpha/beta hydrolase [Luteimonas kalidii]|uniref:Alpha/beta hydrolase-fold protein n=1 Tax=Luteimonas kalidii TaxID=3042025 RepID=A0ABT6JWU4_9GAMM|nr:alpha/beta hydrolase-fold protein [Luteimonas kalidii]MDH5834616.1 alpha/beta hydrolase-fold protein [Luteimonas kalidii]